jgi:hypothetical protein
MSSFAKNDLTRKRKKRLVKDNALTRAVYDALDEDCRKLVDYARRTLAQGLAQASGMPLAVVLESITRMHVGGHLKMVLRGDRLELLPFLKDEGKVINGFYDLGAGRGSRP